MPFYRLVAIGRQAARDGKPIEILGTFNPRHIAKPESIKVDRVRHWISVGAQPTDSVVHALKTSGVWDQIKPSKPA